MPKQRGPGNTADKVDRAALHLYLWKHADKLGRVSRTQKDLAEALDVSYWTVSHIFAEMIVQGRLRKVRGSFYVTDPSLWEWRNPSPEPPRRKK